MITVIRDGQFELIDYSTGFIKLLFIHVELDVRAENYEYFHQCFFDFQLFLAVSFFRQKTTGNHAVHYANYCLRVL